jgi:nitrite reductase/ring-hydroxylating ferredoxin subunit
MDICWTISDGYGGGARPQKLKVNDDELLECDTVESAFDLIEGAVQEDFVQKVSSAYDSNKIKAQIKTLFASKPVEREDD